MRQKRIKRYINHHGADEIAMQMLDNLINKRVYKQKDDYKVPSLLDDWHIHYNNEDAETWVEYGLFNPPDNLTDREITECLYDEFEMRICSPYDCTGKAFTMWIDWHRNPNGMISVIHYKGLDV